MPNLQPPTYPPAIVISRRSRWLAGKLQPQKGFTLIEMLVVLAIMAILASVLVLNLAGQRGKRDVQIAENELVSNIRQIQSNTLSARTLPSGQSAQYYFLKFDLQKPGQYTIQAAYNVSSNPRLVDIQTVMLPPDVLIATITPGSYPVVIDRSATLDTVNPSGPNQYLQTPNCSLLAFAAPFAKVLMNGGCAIANTPNIASGDDYYYIINFETNLPCPNVSCSVSTDSNMSITITNTSRSFSKTVTVYGITGAVTFN